MEVQFVLLSHSRETEEQIVFRAELPFGGDHHFLLYHLRSWPVPTSNPWVWAQIQTPDQIAVNTITGAICEPNLCVGRRPKLCRTGAVYSRPFQPCHRGIISGEKELQQTCKVLVIPNGRNTTIVNELRPGTFVITTPGEVYSKLCDG